MGLSMQQSHLLIAAGCFPSTLVKQIFDVKEAMGEEFYKPNQDKVALVYGNAILGSVGERYLHRW